YFSSAVLLPVALHGIHLRSQTQRSHVGPGRIDVLQTIFLAADCSLVLPPQGIGFIVRPDRILFLVIDHYFIGSVVVLVCIKHRTSPCPGSAPCPKMYGNVLARAIPRRRCDLARYTRMAGSLRMKMPRRQVLAGLQHANDGCELTLSAASA